MDNRVHDGINQGANVYILLSDASDSVLFLRKVEEAFSPHPFQNRTQQNNS